MTINELTQKSIDIENKVKASFGKRNFYKFYWELQRVNIEINKLNNIYYKEEKWIFDLIKDFKIEENLTGMALNNKFCELCNKYQGVYAQVNKKKDGCVVMVLTPYKAYTYFYNRGYAGHMSYASREEEKIRDTRIFKSKEQWFKFYYDGIWEE